MKAVKAKLETTNPDRVATFEKAAAGFAKKVIGNFKDYEFYTGESMDTEGMVALLNYREDGITPYRESSFALLTPPRWSWLTSVTFWKDGLREVKI
jgi:hypothetical protein